MCFKKKSDGILIVDLLGDRPPLELQLDIGINELLTRKRITIDIQAQNVPIDYEYEGKDEDKNYSE